MKRLIDLIPKGEIREKFASGDCELEADFLCFENVYRVIAENVPKDFTIVDLGCYMAAQSYFFTDFKAYVGIDYYDSMKYYPKCDYVAPDRFWTDNSRHFRCSIETFDRIFIQEKQPLDELPLDLDKTYFIASYVPSFEAVNHIFDEVKHGAVYYCGDIKVKGVNSKNIEREFLKIGRKI